MNKLTNNNNEVSFDKLISISQKLRKDMNDATLITMDNISESKGSSRSSF